MNYRNIIVIAASMGFYFCSCLPKYAVDFQTVDFTNITLQKTDFNARIYMYYKWFYPLRIYNLKYKLFINDYEVGDGEYPDTISLGKYADTLLSFPCTIKHKEIAGPLIDVILRGRFDYEVKIDYTLQIKDWTKKYKTSYRGTRRL